MTLAVSAQRQEGSRVQREALRVSQAERPADEHRQRRAAGQRDVPQALREVGRVLRAVEAIAPWHHQHWVASAQPDAVAQRQAEAQQRAVSLVLGEELALEPPGVSVGAAARLPGVLDEQVRLEAQPDVAVLPRDEGQRVQLPVEPRDEQGLPDAALLARHEARALRAAVPPPAVRLDVRGAGPRERGRLRAVDLSADLLDQARHRGALERPAPSRQAQIARVKPRMRVARSSAPSSPAARIEMVSSVGIPGKR